MGRDDLRWLAAFMHEEYPRAYAHLWRDSGAAYVAETFNVAALEAEHNCPDAQLYRVDVDGAPGGFLRIVVDEAPGEAGAFERYLYLHRIYLSHSTQGRGVGRQVIEQLLTLAPECDGVWLDSMAHGNAVGFYERLGFQAIAQVRLEHPQVWPDQAEMVRMERAMRATINSPGP